MVRQSAFLACALAFSASASADGIPISLFPDFPPIAVDDGPLDEASVLDVTSHADAEDIATLAGNGTCELREAVEAWLTATPVDACPAGTTATDAIALHVDEPIDLKAPITVSLPPDSPHPVLSLSIRGEGERRITGENGHFTVGGDVVLALTGLDLVGGSREKGGSIFSEGGLLAIDVNFFGNSAEEGGAIYSTGGLWLSNVKFVGNSADTLGGAVRTTGSSFFSASARDVLFTGNEAGTSGGGAYIEGTSEWVAGNIALLENSAPDGAALASGNAGFQLVNALVHGNVAGAVSGAAIRADAGQVVMEHASILDNDATGVSAADGLTISNSVLSGNTGGDCASLLEHDDFTFSHASDTSCNGVASGAAPLLPLADHGGRYLSRPPMPGGFLIDAGNEDVSQHEVIYDLRGEGFARVVGEASDPGAFEANDAGNTAPFVPDTAELLLSPDARKHHRDNENAWIRIDSWVADNYGLDVDFLADSNHLEVIVNGVPTGETLLIDWVLPEGPELTALSPPNRLWYSVTMHGLPEEAESLSLSEGLVIELVMPAGTVRDLGDPALGNERAVAARIVLQPRSESSSGGSIALFAPLLMLLMLGLRFRHLGGRASS